MISSSKICFLRFPGKKGMSIPIHTPRYELRCILNFRLSAVTRLFRVVQDVINPAFEVEGRHWRSNMTIVLYFYFNTLWTDNKEEIRLAVKTSVLSLLPAHLQAMELCWVELLTTAPIPERVKLVSFLLQVLSHFPRWKVLSWPAIVDVLSECSYDRNDSPKEDGSDVVPLRVALLLISLHMIANGVPVNVSTLLRVKKHLVELMGFENVTEIFHPDGQTARVEFKDIPIVFEEAIPCIGKLTAVFDSSSPFELTRSTMIFAHSQDDKPSKLLVGSLFVDVILVMFCSLKDLLSFPALTLKGILESLCIITYKHDFESPPLIHLHHRLRQAVLRSLEVITEDIGYESRQVVLSFVQGFIKQCGKFMGNVIYKAVEQLAKFITAESRHPSDALIVHARTFLEDIFITYTSKGLFVNMFKHPMSREIFVVLREIFDYSAKDNQNPGEDVKESLLCDVMAKMVDFDRPSFQAALHNLLTYLEVVHPERYGVNTVELVGHHLGNFARRASAEDHMDASALLLIPAVLSENNQGGVRAIISYVEKEIRIILPRALVTFTPLYRLLSSTQSLQRRSGSVTFANGVAHVIFDILEDGLGLKTRVQPTSLATLLQLIVHDDSPEWLPLAISYPKLFLGLVDTTLHFLQGYEWPEAKLEDAFTASLSAGMVIWRAFDDDACLIEKLDEFGSEKIASADYRIRAWNVMALAALRYSDGKCAATLIPFLDVFSIIQFNALRTYVHSESTSWDPATANINHAYIAIKLWMLLARRAVADAGGEFVTFAHVWNELWPPFETLAFNAEKQPDLHPTLALLISSSVADLFVFLHSLQTPLGLQIATLERLKTLAGVDAASRKVSRAIYSLSQPSTSLPSELLLNQISKEIVAAEKLRVLESRKDLGRAPEKRPLDRYRRDIRVPT
ncbi:hypothetical protein AX15_003874 [Amanita polypyramis BW_CC]|nr:hypothetical protein AX15_003874 [Amanita polypyramis BW_CC]